jgi:hypothetical protein
MARPARILQRICQVGARLHKANPIPIAGEISCIPNLAELTAFAERARAGNLDIMHFYVDDTQVTPNLCAAIKALGVPMV